MAESKPDFQAIKEHTAAELRKGGMTGSKADEAARRIVTHVADKAAGKPVPEHFRPIHDANKKR